MIVPGLGDLPVFQCDWDKSPMVKGGFYAAERREPPRSWPLVGVPTGEATGFDILDIDPEGLAWLEENRGRLPLTREYQTQRGRHLLFRHVVRNSSGKIARGVDVRGAGGYAIWWPRQGFEVIDRPLAEFVVPAVRGSTARGDGHVGDDGEVQRTVNLKLRSKYILEKIERMQPGERNNVLYWGAATFGEMIGEGKIKREVAEKCLESAARLNGLWKDDGAEAVRATIRSGVERGISRYTLMQALRGAS